MIRVEDDGNPWSAWLPELVAEVGGDLGYEFVGGAGAEENGVDVESMREAGLKKRCDSVEDAEAVTEPAGRCALTSKSTTGKIDRERREKKLINIKTIRLTTDVWRSDTEEGGPGNGRMRKHCEALEFDRHCRA